MAQGLSEHAIGGEPAYRSRVICTVTPQPYTSLEHSSSPDKSVSQKPSARGSLLTWSSYIKCLSVTLTCFVAVRCGFGTAFNPAALGTITSPLDGSQRQTAG